VGVEAAGVDAVGVVVGVVTDVAGTSVLLPLLESPGFMTKIRSTVTTTTAAAPPIAFISSERARVGFQFALFVGRWAGVRRLVTSSGSYR
jgi:hypothetical protein